MVQEVDSERILGGIRLCPCSHDAHRMPLPSKIFCVITLEP